jgi:hypothetical protein
MACGIPPTRRGCGSPKVVDRKPGDVFWGDPVAHSVENLGDNPIHNLIVELKPER